MILPFIYVGQGRLSNREFCKQHDICEKTYYYWLRRVREAAILQTESDQPCLVPLEKDTDDRQEIRST